jgi:hypothetical protein
MLVGTSVTNIYRGRRLRVGDVYGQAADVYGQALFVPLVTAPNKTPIT